MRYLNFNDSIIFIAFMFNFDCSVFERDLMNYNYYSLSGI